MSIEDKENTIKELSSFGISLYYLVDKGIINLKEIENILFIEDTDKLELLFPKLINKITLEDIELSQELYRTRITKLDVIKEVLKDNKNKYPQLRNIVGIALDDKLADSIIKDDTYFKYLNSEYLYMLTDLIKKDISKDFIRYREDITEYRRLLKKIIKNDEKELCNDIDNYYIGRLTK